MPHTAIRAVRQAKGMTLQDVAEKVGATAATVSRWEREPQRVTVPVLTNLARVLDCQPSDLLACAIAGANPDQAVGKAEQFDPEAISAAAGFDASSLFAITIPGDHMQPTLNAGDMVFVLADQEMSMSGLYGFRHGEVAGVRRVTRSLREDQFIVTLDNTVYGYSETVTLEELLPVLIGRVTLIVKRV